MSLVRLLTAGKSLIGVKEPTNRYQMRSRHLLPKFNPDKNPFAAPRRPSTGAPSSPAVQEMTPAGVATSGPDEAKLPPPCPTGLAEAGRVPRTPGIFARALNRISGRVRKWTRREGPSVRKAEAKSVAPRIQESPVQGELSLDRVRVVRNDLSEADVEIVPARPAVKPKGQLLEPVVAGIELTETPTT